MGGSLLHDNSRTQEAAPFFHNAQSDIVQDVECGVCGAPLHVYEVKHHETTCKQVEDLRPTGGQDVEN